MKRLFCLLAISIAYSVIAASDQTVTATQAQPLRVIAFGAHPDDAELKASGVAALWAAAGAKVKFVAMTNGDVGHFEISRRPAGEAAKGGSRQSARASSASKPT